METVSKMKYSRTDRLVLESVMPFLDCLFFQLLFRWSMLFWHLLWTRRY